MEERLHSPAAFPEAEEKCRELFHRLDSGLSDYCEGLLGTDKDELIGAADRIAARFGVRDYLKTRHTFREPELEFLLRQDDPLDVVAKHTPPIPMLLEMSGAIADISAIEDALGDPDRRPEHSGAMAVVDKAAHTRAERGAVLEGIAQKHCHLETLAERGSDSLDFREVSVWGMKAALEAAYLAGREHEQGKQRGASAPEKSQEVEQVVSPREELRERAFVCRDELMSDLQKLMANPDLDMGDFMDLADRVSIVNECYHHLAGHVTMDDHARALLEFENPLDVMAARLYNHPEKNVDLSSIVWDIYEEREYLDAGSILPYTPSQAAQPARHSARDTTPAALPDADIDAMRRTLHTRMEGNLASMLAELHEDITAPVLSNKDLAGLAEHITAVNSAYEYITHTTLPAGQVEYLLQFQNPLEVVADSWPVILDGLIDMDEVMWDICDKENALPDYPLAPDPAVQQEQAESAKRSLLADVKKAQERIAENSRQNGSDHSKDTPEPEL
jgi:hypothetical protein